MRKEPFELLRDDGLVIRGEARIPARSHASIILCHGFKGFAHWGFFPHLADSIADAGMTAITFDFSGSGIGPDRETSTELSAFEHNTFTQELDDLARVIRESKWHEWLSERYGLFGHSRGGGVATLHASRDPNVGALVTWAPISHTRRWMPEDEEGWRQRGYSEVVNARTGQVLRLGVSLLEEHYRRGDELDIEKAASRVKAPWLIIHGNQDASVRPAEGERLHAAAPGSKLQLIDANHAFDITHPMKESSPALDTAIHSTIDFYRQHLG
jgi:uncharacterized protein